MVRTRREAVLCQSGSRAGAGRRLEDVRFPHSHLPLSCFSSFSYLYLYLSCAGAGRRLEDARSPLSHLYLSGFSSFSYLSLSLYLSHLSRVRTGWRLADVRSSPIPSSLPCTLTFLSFISLSYLSHLWVQGEGSQTSGHPLFLLVSHALSPSFLIFLFLISWLTWILSPIKKILHFQAEASSQVIVACWNVLFQLLWLGKYWNLQFLG